MATVDKNTHNTLQKDTTTAVSVQYITKAEEVQTSKTPKSNLDNTISLSKTVYGKNNAKKILDEEFSEFVIQIKDYKEFFELYNSYFYNLDDETHKLFKEKSNEYLEYTYTSRNAQILDELDNQVIDLQDQINSIERHHPFFKNGSILARESDKDSEGSYDKWLLQSNRKRLINEEIYTILKSRLKITKPDNEFIIFITIDGLNGILDGPPIFNSNEIFIKNEVINTYNG
jgi:hypothetical protein